MRVLIATVTAGAGHVQAAAAVEEAWRAERPDDEIQRVDVLDFVSRLYRRVYLEGYSRLIEHAPELWGMVFKKTDDPDWVEKVSEFRRGFARRTYRRFYKHLQEFQADIVICTHYLPMEIMGYLKSKKPGPHPFTASVVTDFEAHSLWMEQAVDLYCVAADEVKASLVARGETSGEVAVTGIPIAARFSGRFRTDAIRRRHGLRDDLPIVLTLSGGFGMGPVEEILGELDRVKKLFQNVVVTGRNEELRRELACVDRAHPTRVLGFVGNMEEWMSVADLIVTKPGGLTTSEAMALGKPLIIVNPIPGQESANSDFLLERGAAIKVNRMDDLSPRIERLLGSKKLLQMQESARQLGRPKAARTICREILRRV